MSKCILIAALALIVVLAGCSEKEQVRQTRTPEQQAQISRSVDAGLGRLAELEDPNSFMNKMPHMCDERDDRMQCYKEREEVEYQRCFAIHDLHAYNQCMYALKDTEG
jgi:hypothetical protein